MAPRRSARLRSQTPVKEEPSVALTPSPIKLSSLVERDETPLKEPQPNIETVLSTPLNRFIHEKSSLSSHSKFTVKTPSTAGQVRPAHEEMHPSKVRQSTSKQPDTGLILGFNPIKRDSNGNIIKETVVNNTPSKTKVSPPSHLSTPKFDFKFAGDDNNLSEEARKLMENVRGDVARIKAQMILNKGEQERKERAAEESRDGRKFAKPRGRAGRFSDAHMAEFKKMDSIAGHASAFRVQPGRFTSVDKSLKRKSSKAALDESERKASPSKSPVKGFKRMKRAEGEDASINRLQHHDGNLKKSAIPQPRSTFRSSLMTPTRASSARFATAKPQKTSLIPSLTRSPASRLAAPRTPQTEFNPKLKKTLPSLGNLKSILRRRQPLFSNDPTKVAAGTHIATPGFNPDINLSDLPTKLFGDDSNQTPSPSKKRVEFTPSTKTRYDLAQASPSPSKIPAAHMMPALSDVVYPTLPPTTPPKEKGDTPTIRRVRQSGVSAPISPFPNLPAVAHGIANKKRHRDEDEAEARAKNIPVAEARTSPFPNMPAVPHGIVNKKRRRSDDDDKGSENIPPANSVANEQRNTKKLKLNTPNVSVTASPSPVKSRVTTPGRGIASKSGTPGTAWKASRGVLSLSRLNMLSKPKSRR